MQQAAQEAFVGQLAGLADRRGILRSLRVELDRAGRHDESVAVVVCGLDGFEQADGGDEPAGGDPAAQTFARVALTRLRPHDHAGRYGQGRFVLVLPETGTCAAVDTAERLRAAFEDEPVTASLGVALFPEQTDPASLLRAASCALHEAQAAGRNCVRSSASARPARLAI